MNKQIVSKKFFLSISSLVLTAFLSLSFAAGEYFGFDSYQAYLNNYYSQQVAQGYLPTIPTTPARQIAQSPKTIQPITVFTPATTEQAQQSVATVPVEQNYYNGFLSYQAYLNNYYATIGSISGATPENLEPLQTQSCLSVNDILKTDIEGQYLACDGTLYTVTRNTETAVTAPKFLLNYSIQYERITEVAPQAEGTIYTPVYVYPELTPKAEVVDPVPAIAFNKIQALEFSIGNSYTFENGLKLTTLEINDNRCFAGQYCAQAGEVVAKFRIDFRNEQNLLTVTIEPGEEPEINFLLANTSIKFTGLKYDQVSGQPVIQSVVRSRQ